ncbi:MAG: hypothetical protein KF726_15580 [Anaerolineae bacterium]|nr:hypothetical protein [Anaerolineae bacterium]
MSTTERISADRRGILWLLLIAFVFVGTFVFCFTLPYSYAQHGSQPQRTMVLISKTSAESFIVYVVSFALMFLLYALGVRIANRLAGNWQNVLLLLLGGAIFVAVLLPMYPYDSADVYDYIIRGRMTAFYGANPLAATPQQVAKDDPFFPFAAWTAATGAYGPAWEWIAAGAARVAGDDAFANVLIFKLIAVAGYLATGLLVALTLRRIAPDRVSLGAYLWLWNPFVILMVGEGAHNDALMSAFLLLGVFFLLRRWYIAGTLAALIGALIKFVPLALVALIAVVALRELRPRLKLRYVIVGGLSSLILIGVISAPFWTGDVDAILNLNRRSRLFTGSTATVVRKLLVPLLDNKPMGAGGSETPITNLLISRTAFGLLALFVAWQLLQTYRDRSGDPMRPVRSLALILMFYLLVSSFWFMSWYVLWVVPLAALFVDSPLRRLILIFSYLVTCEMVMYQYVGLRPGNWMPDPWRDLIPVLSYMGVIYVWLVVEWWWQRSRLLKSQRLQVVEQQG